MKLRFLGTGDGECKIKKRTTKEYRRRPSLLIDETLLIDPTMDIFDFAEFFSYDGLFDQVESVLITHSHPAHFDPEALALLAKRRRLRVYASEAVTKRLSSIENIEPHTVEPLTMYDIPDYRIIPLLAPHDVGEGEVALHYAICRDKAMLYALDGGGIHYSAWWLLKELRLDVAVLDCALADAEPTAAVMEHGCLSTVRLCGQILSSAGVLGERSRIILSHIPTDRRRSIHDELSERASDCGMTVAYDGYFLTV